MSSSMASSTRARSESSLARSRSSWAGESSNSIPVILLANACGVKHSKTLWVFTLEITSVTFHESAVLCTGCMACTLGYSLSPRACLWAGRGSGSSLGFPSEAGLNGRVSIDSCLLESLKAKKTAKSAKRGVRVIELKENLIIYFSFLTTFSLYHDNQNLSKSTFMNKST